jgi:hypothetical protein
MVIQALIEVALKVAFEVDKASTYSLEEGV